MKVWTSQKDIAKDLAERVQVVRITGRTVGKDRVPKLIEMRLGPYTMSVAVKEGKLFPLTPTTMPAPTREAFILCAEEIVRNHGRSDGGTLRKPKKKKEEKKDAEGFVARVRKFFTSMFRREPTMLRV